jgi:hypothetical protein
MSSTRKRLSALREWTDDRLCKGRSMKTPGETDFSVVYTQPRVFVALYPWRLTEATEFSIAPSILIIPDLSPAQDPRTYAYDKSEGAIRSRDLGAQLNVRMVFCVYEPGERLSELQTSHNPVEDLMEVSNSGFYTLTDWVDEAVEQLLRDKSIPGSDLFVYEDTIRWAPMMQEDAIVDQRPLYYAVLQAGFGGKSLRRESSTIDDLLK